MLSGRGLCDGLIIHSEDNSVTNILLMNKENGALKLVDEIILFYDARSKKTSNCYGLCSARKNRKVQFT